LRNIQKNHEPRCLAQHRCRAHSDYDNFDRNEKDEVRLSLLLEQGGICAYCMQRIKSEIGGMKIEHWRCQDRYSDDQLVYGNMLGVCMGGEGHPRRDQHCDTYKGNADFCSNPANPAHNVEAVIRYLGDGRIKANDAQLDRELNEVLNLNHPMLVNNRKAILISFQESLARVGHLKAAAIRRHIDQWSQPFQGNLQPFCMVVIYWLRKKLVRIG